MIFVAAIMSVLAAAWGASWFYFMNDAPLLIQHVLISLAVTAWFFEIRKQPVLYRSLVVMLVITFWVDAVLLILWGTTGIDTGAALFVGLCVGVIYLTTRSYDIEGDEVTGDNVFILFLRPRSNPEVIKSFPGAPFSSVCICCKGNIWSFRHATKKYERMIAHEAMLNCHVAFNTGIFASEKILAALDAKVGLPSGHGVRCVYVLKDVLKMLDLTPKTILHYIPGVYADQLLRKA